MDFVAHYDSPLGGITMASDGRSLTGLWFDGQKHFAETLAADHADVGAEAQAEVHADADAHSEKDLPVFAEAREWLDRYFSGRDPGPAPRIELRGSAFRRRVWEILTEIPYGETRTYGEIARQIAREQGLAAMSAQAVGGAVGHNPVALMIPCHRVVVSDGSLTGYAGGTEKKRILLEMESRAERHN